LGITIRKRLSVISVVIAMIAMTFAYQNCARIEFVGEKLSMSSGGGNGDGYEGKPDAIFLQHEPAAACADIGANGQPLPNQEIFYYQSLSYSYLVRRNCQDIKPEKIDNSQIQVTESSPGNRIFTSLVYNGQSYTPMVEGDFAVIAANCPAGMSLKPGAVRTNIFKDSQNFATGNWIYHEGIQNPPELIGTIAGLPGWAIRREGTAMEFYRRAHQVPLINAGTRYALTYLVKSGTKTSTSIHLWQWQRSSYIFDVDLITGAVTLQDNSGFVSASALVSSFSGGKIITLYFEPVSTWEMDIGITPQARWVAPGVPGDDVYVTAAQLEEVSNFCQ
jgi:hypothetical protein